MNKGMIMLGLILIAGLSFAEAISWQYPWQGIVWNRYACSWTNVSNPQYQLAYGYMSAYAGPYDMLYMYDALYSMRADAIYMRTDHYASPFRADMAAYNSNNGAFRAIFNAVLRTYLQHGGDRTYVLGMLNEFNSQYRDCISSST